MHKKHHWQVSGAIFYSLHGCSKSTRLIEALTLARSAAELGDDDGRSSHERRGARQRVAGVGGLSRSTILRPSPQRRTRARKIGN
jgi:hypothetical protein